MSGSRGRGRPVKTQEQTALEAARVINTALVLRLREQVRLETQARLKELGRLRDQGRLNEQAARTIETELVLRQKEPGRLKELGFKSEGMAVRFVNKRRRGLVAGLIGRDGAMPPENQLRRASQLVIEHGMRLRDAALLFEVDLPNLRRAVRAEKEQAALVLARQRFWRVLVRLRALKAQADGI